MRTNLRTKKNFDYTEKTKGRQLAAKTRKEANSLTESERTELFSRGMQIIYGDTIKA